MASNKRFKRRRFYKGGNPSPPVTFRFCVVCERHRAFKYNPRVFHSECEVCGGRFAKGIRRID